MHPRPSIACGIRTGRGMWGGTFIWELDADYDGQSQDLLDAAYDASLPQTK